MSNSIYWQAIVCWQSVKFDANFEYILNFAEV